MAVRRVVSALALLLAAAGGAAVAGGDVARAAPQSPEPRAWIVVDADTGVVLAAKDAHEPLPPASTAKIMTALAAVERLPSDALITVSELAANQPASKISMLAGQEWRFEDALASLMMVSANDAAYAIAETTSGSLAAFADAVTATGKRYGMRDSTFSDPAGFDDESAFGGGPRMSAFDIAVATRNALGVPQLMALAALPELRFTDPAGAERYLPNHNKLLELYDGANGFKTGFTEAAGHTLVATATREGRTIIAVVLNTYDTYGWASNLLDQGFATPPADRGTGERVPEVRVSPYAQRQADLLSFVALTRGGPVDATIGTGGDEVAAADGAERTSPTTAVPAASDGATDSSGGDSLVNPRTLTIGGVATLGALVTLRRRAVRRRRARRLARRRETADAMRRGSLPVVDGRYRAGTRTGPPLPSHVTVRPRESDDRRRRPR